MDENEISALQTMVEYYRNKCNKLEHDFVQYQIKAETIVKQLRHQLEHEHQESVTDVTDS